MEKFIKKLSEGKGLLTLDEIYDGYALFEFEEIQIECKVKEEPLILPSIYNIDPTKCSKAYLYSPCVIEQAICKYIYLDGEQELTDKKALSRLTSFIEEHYLENQ